MYQKIQLVLIAVLFVFVGFGCVEKKTIPLGVSKVIKKRPIPASQRVKVVKAKPKKIGPLSTWELPVPVKKAWALLMRKFYRKSYNSCLSRNRIKVCCKKGCCEGMVSQIEIRIDKKGLLKEWKIIKRYGCQQVSENSIPLSRIRRATHCYLQFFPKQRKFEKALWGTWITARIGSAYGC